MPSLSEIGDLSCITSCLVLPGFLMDTLLSGCCTRSCIVEVKGPDNGNIWFCITVPDGEPISCSNEDCPYGKFRPSCLSLANVTIPKKWCYPHCSGLQQFKRYSMKQTAGKVKGKVSFSAVSSQASLRDTINFCTCKVKVAEHSFEEPMPNSP